MSRLASPSPALLVSERGGPVASPGILAELKKLHPALGLRWIGQYEHSGWVVTWEWPLSDPRWERVRTQEISRDAAYDILGHLPAGCSVDEARGYVETHLKNYPKEEIARLRHQMAHWNAVEVPKQQVQGLVTDSLDAVAQERRAPKGQIFSFRRGAR